MPKLYGAGNLASGADLLGYLGESERDGNTGGHSYDINNATSLDKCLFTDTKNSERQTISVIDHS